MDFIAFFFWVRKHFDCFFCWVGFLNFCTFGTFHWHQASVCLGKADGILVRLQLGTELCLRPLPRWKCHRYNSSHSCIARKPGASTWWKANSFNRIAETWFQIWSPGLLLMFFVYLFCVFTERDLGIHAWFLWPMIFLPKDPRFCVENLVRKLSLELAEADPSEEAAWEAAAVRGSNLLYCTLVDCFCMLL